jgi:hypothetical protein
MKKIYTLLTLLLISGVVFSQTQRAGNTLTAVKVIKEVNNMPSSHAKAVIDSLYYDGAQADAIGTGAAATFGVYSYFPIATLLPHVTAAHKFLSVKVYVMGATNVSAAQLRIYSDQGITMLYSQSFTPVEGWNNVVLTTPYTIPASTNLYVGYNITCTGGYPAGCDAGPANTNGNWIDFGGTWQHLTDLDATLIYNWNIRVMCGTVPAAPVAYCTPLTWTASNVTLTNTATSGTFTLSNTGSGTLTCSSITGLSAPFTTTLVPATVSLTTGQTKTFTFSYTPTVVGTNNETVILNTNGGTVTINLTGNGVNCGAYNTFPLVESFEGATFPPACWTKASTDGGTGWASITSGTTPLPGWQGGTMTVPTGGGTKAAYCTWNTGGSTYNDQWLITQQIAVPTNGMLTFSLLWFGHYQDLFDVKLSTTTNATGSFTTTLLSLDSNQYLQQTWKQFTINLNSYAGQNVYIAFNEHIADNYTDGAFMALDLVRVDITTGINQPEEELMSVYPNPASDMLYVNCKNLKSVEIFNLLGENVASYGNVKAINVADLTKGIYFVKLATDSKTVTKKINIAR